MQLYKLLEVNFNFIDFSEQELKKKKFNNSCLENFKNVRHPEYMLNLKTQSTYYQSFSNLHLSGIAFLSPNMIFLNFQCKDTSPLKSHLNCVVKIHHICLLPFNSFLQQFKKKLLLMHNNQNQNSSNKWIKSHIFSTKNILTW